MNRKVFAIKYAPNNHLMWFTLFQVVEIHPRVFLPARGAVLLALASTAQPCLTRTTLHCVAGRSSTEKSDDGRQARRPGEIDFKARQSRGAPFEFLRPLGGMDTLRPGSYRSFPHSSFGIFVFLTLSLVVGRRPSLPLPPE